MPETYCLLELYDAGAKVEGETQAPKGFEGIGKVIRVGTPNYSMHQLTSMGAGESAGGGGISVSPISFSLTVDKSCTKILSKACTGEPFNKGIFHLFTGGMHDQFLEWKTILLEDLNVTYAGMSGADGGGMATLSVTFAFSRIKITERVVGDDGQLRGGAEEFGWDLRKNSRW